LSVSFTIYGDRLKAIASVYRELQIGFVLHFTREEASASIMAPDHARMVELHLRPIDYRCDSDSIWVRGNIDMLSKYASKLRKGETVQVSIRDDKLYIGTIQPAAVIPEGEVFDDERAPAPKLSEAARISVVSDGFKRVARSPIPDLKNIGFDIDQPNGYLIFLNERHSVIDLGRQQPDWFLRLEGKARLLYDREAFLTLLIPSLSARTDIVFSREGPAIVEYEETEYKVKLYIAPKVPTEGRDLIGEILAKPRPARTEIFRMAEREGKQLLSFIRAISQTVPYMTVSFYPWESPPTYWSIYWGEGPWQGFIKVNLSLFERYETPSGAVAGLFRASELIKLLKDIETLRLFIEYLPSERKMSLVGEGPKVAPRELAAEQTIDGMFAGPQIQGTSVFMGPVDILKRTVEDAEVAEDEYLVFYTTPYEINAFGRNAVYYSATFEADSFKVVEENHISISKNFFKLLKAFLSSIPAQECSIGKSEKRSSDIYLTCETALGPLVATISQEENEVESAERGYKFEREKAAAPKVEKLPVPPAAPPMVHETVYILADVPTFVGADHKEYGPFKAGEEAWIPKPQAEDLVREGRASWTKPVPPLVVAPPLIVPPMIAEVEFNRRFDTFLDEFTDFNIKLLRSSLEGEIHYIIPEREREFVARFTKETIMEQNRDEIQRSRAEKLTAYREAYGRNPRLAEVYLEKLRDSVHGFAKNIADKTFKTFIAEAKRAKAEGELLKVTADAIRELEVL
jgi:hypothetical protein